MDQPVQASTQIDWVVPSSDLKDFVNTFFVLTASAGRREGMMPAYTAQLLIFAEGNASIHYPDGGVGHSGDIVCNAPLLRAAPTVMEGPLTCIGASFTPLGWAMLANLPVDAVHDTTLASQEIFHKAHHEDLLGALEELRDGAIDARALIARIEAVLRDLAQRSPILQRTDHRALLAKIDAWLASSLNPAVAELYDDVALSPRQVQRLCKRYFGVPPAQLAKRYRAIRAAMLLANEELPSELRDDALSAFFDQAHLIHDIRRFTGRTPKRLSGDPMSRDMLDPDAHGKQGSVVSGR